MIDKFCIFLIIVGSFVFTVSAQPKNDETSPQPKLLSAPSPKYPKEAKEAGIGGRIVVRVVVDASGAIVSVDNPVGPYGQQCGSREIDPRVVALRNSVVEALKQAKFEPAMKDGKPVKSVSYIGSTFDPFDGNVAEREKKIISGGVINGRALSLPRPEYPSDARPSRAAGAVAVQVFIDEGGKVVAAEAVSGHPLLRRASVNAACSAKFAPVSLQGKFIRVSGVITYNFVP
ncbi:MAG TPA: energy transducer TonB [Pyrinomonadaceae bacterium]|nr:energy transducer TonB [Pyrinomonadaceae bacterium]